MVALTIVVLCHSGLTCGGAVIISVLIDFGTTRGCAVDDRLRLFRMIFYVNAHCTIV